MNAYQRRTARRLYERAFGTHVCYWMTVQVDKRAAGGSVVHNRTPDDEYAKDVEEARRLLALHESMHNGAIRNERGETWYGSQAFQEWDRAVTSDMGILLGRIMDYADAVRLERDRYLKLAYADAVQVSGEELS